MTTTTEAATAAQGIQTSFTDLGTSLEHVTFVVVDLETTGSRPGPEGITEIGAVKVRGGVVIGEYATLVDPGVTIAPQIERLTGITTRMVHDAPRIGTLLPSFLEFLGGDAVLVAHNAPFDVGFLKAACAGHGVEWPHVDVVDTVRLARALVTRDEVRNHKLSSLAHLFGSTTTPNHRALADARATVDVLHGLLARLGSIGVSTREDLLTFSARVPAHRRRKASLADGLPDSPGVYVFRDGAGEALYVGTSVNIRRRVQSYFTAAEKRRGMGLMVDLAAAVTPIPCPTALEAHVREIRLIATHRPRFNRRSSRPERIAWLKITNERFPRLSVVRGVLDDGAAYVGPFRSQVAATQARNLIHDVTRVRQCTTSIGPRTRRSICVLGEIGRCDAPCDARITPDDYAVVVKALRTELDGGCPNLLEDVEARIVHLADEERFEDARATRDALLELLRGIDRHDRRAPLVQNPELVAARPRPAGGWEFVVVKYGRLAGSAVAPAGHDPRPVIDSLRVSCEAVNRPSAGLAALSEETDVVLRWLEQDGTRVVDTRLPWSCPVHAAARALRVLEPRLSRARDDSHGG